MKRMKQSCATGAHETSLEESAKFLWSVTHIIWAANIVVGIMLKRRYR